MPTPEGQILKAIMEYLAARRILHFRMNTGAMVSESKGKKRFMRFGSVGMADILAFPTWSGVPVPYWFEVKTEKGKQAESQKLFEGLVTAEGHQYFVVRSVEDVEAALR